MTGIPQYLQDILAYLDDIEQFTAEGKPAFMLDRRTQYAVVRAYEVVGEIVKRLPEELLARQPQVQWQRIKAFRDFLAHNYNRVVLHNVWQAVEDLPALRAAVKTLLDELPDQAGQ